MSGIDEEGAAEALPKLCDLCGATVADDSEWYASVRDSSVVHAYDPKGNGRRLLVECTSEHLKQLIEQYKRRPFIDAELWVGQIGRAIRHHPQGISADELAEETGLNPAQIDSACCGRTSAPCAGSNSSKEVKGRPPTRPTNERIGAIPPALCRRGT